MTRVAVFCLLAASIVRPLAAQAPAADKPKKIGLSNAAELSYVLTSGNSETRTLAFADESLSSGDDLRLDVTNALAVAMTDKLALKVALQLLYDNQPALRQTPLVFPDALFPPTALVSYPLDKLDAFFTVALVITY